MSFNRWSDRGQYSRAAIIKWEIHLNALSFCRGYNKLKMVWNQNWKFCWNWLILGAFKTNQCVKISRWSAVFDTGWRNIDSIYCDITELVLVKGVHSRPNDEHCNRRDNDWDRLRNRFEAITYEHKYIINYLIYIFLYI